MADKSKNKKKSKAPKVELRSDEKEGGKPKTDEVDEFVGGVNRWAEKLRPHAGKIVAAVVLLAGAGIGIAVYGWLQDRKAAAATESLAEAIDIVRKEIKAPDDQPDPSTGPDAPDENESFPDREARANATLTALGGAERLSAPSALIRARALMDLKKFDEAARAFKEAADGLPLEAAIEARAGIGYAYEAKAEATEDASAREAALGEALTAFRSMQPAADGPRRDYAMFHEGRILSVLGKRDEAVAVFKKLLEEHTETTLKPDVEARLENLGAE